MYHKEGRIRQIVGSLWTITCNCIITSNWFNPIKPLSHSLKFASSLMFPTGHSYVVYFSKHWFMKCHFQFTGAYCPYCPCSPTWELCSGWFEDFDGKDRVSVQSPWGWGQFYDLIYEGLSEQNSLWSYVMESAVSRRQGTWHSYQGKVRTLKLDSTKLVPNLAFVDSCTQN